MLINLKIKYNMRKSLIRWTIAAGMWGAVLVPAWSAENNCAKCHEQTAAPESAGPAHSFAEWQKSIHAKRGISCDACHGGDALAKDKAAAHQGIAQSSDPSSRIYFDKIPETCGACHAKELKGFKVSVHYKELESSGRGPNCVTCHGSMATRLMTPREMESICTLCHRRPTQAYAALLTLQSSQKLLGQVEERVKAMQSQKIDVAGQTADLDRARQSYRDALVTWHSFDMTKVSEQAQSINQSLRNAMHELELKKIKMESPGQNPQKRRGK